MKRFLPFVALLATVAPRALAGTTARDGEVRGVSVLPATNRVEIVIDISGAAQVQDFTLSNPARLVIDLIGTHLSGPAALYDGQNRGGVRNVRYAQFKPGVVRVVIDLDVLKDYQIERATAQAHERAENHGCYRTLLLHLVQDALMESGLSPHFLEFEIAESVIITHAEKAVTTLVKLKQMGISITVDDFGTGYSSLSYLARLPIHGVKVDQRFVHGLEQNKNDEAITQAIIALSHSLGLRCTAEGVETDAQFNFLRAHGCEEAQGFLITKPLASGIHFSKVRGLADLAS